MAKIKIVDIRLSKAIEGHLLWCAGQNYSDNTIAGYRHVGNIFLKQVGDRVFSKITVADVEAFMRWAVETPVTPGGVTVHVDSEKVLARKQKAPQNEGLFLFL